MTNALPSPGCRGRHILIAAALAAGLAATPFAQAAEGQIHVIAEMDAKPGSEKPMRDLLLAFAAAARQEPGCVAYQLMEAFGEQGRFFAHEIWASKASLDAHSQSPPTKTAMQQVTPLLGKPFKQIFLAGLP